MNLFLALLMLAAPQRAPQVYYYNGSHLVKLRTIETGNIGHTVLRFFVHSPHELRYARVDSSDVSLCLPDDSVRTAMKLEGRWYTIRWYTKLTTGSAKHIVTLYECRHKKFSRTFFINVEGSKRINKPQGVY